MFRDKQSHCIIIRDGLRYLHSEDRAAVVSRYFAYLKHLAVAAFPDNLAQLEVLRADLLARAIDILFRYRHCLHHVR